METVAVVLGLITLAVVVATLASRLRAPAPSLLVIAGLLVGLIPAIPPILVPPDLIGLVVLPPLLYAAAIDVSVPELRAVLRPIIALVIGLVGVTALVVAAVTHAISPQVPLAAAFVLGAILASTDPVAVSALARRLRLRPRLLALVQGESLLNDATSLVLFRVAVAVVVAGGGVGAWQVGQKLVWLGGVGALIGWVLAVFVEQLRRRTHDPVLETVLALVTPYIVYLAAESVKSSGVTAVVICGLRLSRRRHSVTRGPSRLQIDHAYAVVVFLLESVVFALIGLEIPGLVERLRDTDQRFILPALVVTVALLVTRVLWVFPTGLLGRHTSRGIGGSSWGELAVLSWAGTRGVVPLAAALAIPLTTAAGQPFPERDFLQVMAITCIALTLVVQGLTLDPLVRRLDVREDSDDMRHQRALTQHELTVAALARLDELMPSGQEPDPPAVKTLREDLERQEWASRAELDRAFGPDSEEQPPTFTSEAYRRLRLELLATEHSELIRLREERVVGERVSREFQRQLDLEEARLREHPPEDRQ